MGMDGEILKYVSSANVACGFHAGGPCVMDKTLNLYTKPYYRVFMLGFMAGFPYLGGLDEKLFTPRLNTPRTKD